MKYEDFDLDFFKEENEKIWQVSLFDKKTHEQNTGAYCFSFDKNKIFNFWTDYPDKLSIEQKELFDKEFPNMIVLK